MSRPYVGAPRSNSTTAGAGFVDGPGDGRVVSHARRLGGGPDETRRRDAAAQPRLCVDLPPADGDASEERADLFEVGARVDERSQGHVPGDAGEAMEPRR